MHGKLLTATLTRFLSGVVLMGVLLFLPAGTLHYPEAWRLMGVLFLPMLIVGIVLLVKNPALLEKRLRSKEENGTQKKVVGFSALLFLAVFILAGLQKRFAFMLLPPIITIPSAVLFFFFYLLYAEVLRENSYLSRVIEVQEGQKVIDTGLYGLVRHPMYFATIGLFLLMPLVLGSFFGFLLFCGYPFLLKKRILAEEELLRRELYGYEAYCQKVRYRLIPYIW